MGQDVVEEHDEARLGHEELYVVLTGRATFVLDGEEVEVPAGSAVFLRDPEVRRYARAEEAGTTVLALGGRPGQHGRSRPGYFFAAYPKADEGMSRVRRELDAGLVEKPEHPPLLYHRACILARAGRLDEARPWLERALERDPELQRYADEDEDLVGLRVAGSRSLRRAAATPAPGRLRSRHHEHSAELLRRARRRATRARGRARSPCAPARRRRGRARPQWRRREHVTVGDRAHRDVGDEGAASELGMASASGFVPASGSPPSGCASRAGEVAVSAATSPPAASRRTYQPSIPVGKRRRDDDLGMRRRCGQLRVDDRRQGEVAECAVAVPALVAGLGLHAFRPRVGAKVVERLEPVDPREPVAELPARLSVEEVARHGGVGRGEAERGDPLLRPHVAGPPRPPRRRRARAGPRAGPGRSGAPIRRCAG